MLHLAVRFPSLPVLLFLLTVSAPIAAQDKVRNEAQEQAHRSPDWPIIAAHLVDPATGTTQMLEMQGDILRARRFPYDALDYYGYVLKRDGKRAAILKKIGVTHLELRNMELARAYFQRAVKLDKKDAEAWNNLGAVEYLDRKYAYSVSDYKRAVKLQDNSAIYHSNLAIAYFDQHDFSKGRKEMDKALRLDPNLFQEASATGVSAHVLSPEDKARFCLEMAKTYAQQGNEVEMLRSLKRAAEAGLDLSAEMQRDKGLAAYKSDPRVLVLMHNAKILRNGNTVAREGEPPVIPPLAAALK
jgi:tetratricopeptide (TPR) repeat protein